ncbi:MAG: hypothetical protein M3R36_09005 [Bacteroidota bacterium]|nr:hypothetical protein [Bacteroidota bacterium]
MKVEVKVTKGFKKQAKPFLKKYCSLTDELRKLEKQLCINPKQGQSIGQKAYKIRLAVKSKGKGKVEELEL